MGFVYRCRVGSTRTTNTLIIHDYLNLFYKKKSFKGTNIFARLGIFNYVFALQLVLIRDLNY